MKTSVSSYSYHKLTSKGEMDLFQVMDTPMASKRGSPANPCTAWRG